MAATCDLCGRVEDDASVALTWSSGVERGVVRRCCAACTREHVRSVEARLETEHW